MRYLLAIALLAATGPAQQTREQQVAWLREHLAGDLAGLAAMIGDARVVCLGEASHGDGTAFVRKVEICRFLHRKLGFSVLVFESGLYDCHRAWQEIRAGGDAAAAVRGAVFPVWSGARQLTPLWRYLAEQRGSDRPLELAGFDFQPSGVHTRQGLRTELIAAVGADPALGAAWREVAGVYEALGADGGAAVRSYRPAGRAGFYAGSARLAELLDGRRPFLAQVVRSQSSFLRFLWNVDFRKPDPKVFNLREQQGAANLLWLLRQRYKGRKLIVWGATSHLSRNRQQIETRSAPHMVPVGHHLARELGDRVFMLGFVCHRGRSGIARAGAPVRAIPPAPAGSFADLLAATGRDGGFLDLRQARWLQARRVARPMGHAPMRADWSRVVDAFCFIRELEPALPVPPTIPKK